MLYASLYSELSAWLTLGYEAWGEQMDGCTAGWQTARQMSK